MCFRLKIDKYNTILGEPSYDDYNAINDKILFTKLQKRIFGSIYEGGYHQVSAIRSHLIQKGYKPNYDKEQISAALQTLKKKGLVKFECGRWDIVDNEKNMNQNQCNNCVYNDIWSGNTEGQIFCGEKIQIAEKINGEIAFSIIKQCEKYKVKNAN